MPRAPSVTPGAGLPSLAAASVAELRACMQRFGGDAAAGKTERLKACAAGAIDDPDVLLDYHDCLLFLLAYPETAALHAAATRELGRVAAAARCIADHGRARAKARLANSGVAWTPTTIAFGYDIARWLAREHPGHAEIDSFDPTGAPLPDLLRHALPPLEFELLAAEGVAAEDFLAQASDGRRGSQLRWLVDQVECLPCADAVRVQLFDAVKAYITITPGATTLSRTFVRGLPVRTFLHRGPLQRGVDPRAILDDPLAPPRPLARAEAVHLLDAARAMLACLGRETDALAAAAPEGVEYHELGRGTAIALYTMRPGHRLPLDSHVGFMLFKNTVPVAYGGGWPFFATAKIGVNIFPPYRGAESALLFCQVLRVYRQRFGIAHFVAEPSQFGAGNREGLESGAFWFYYRLGFRPVTPGVAALAAAEYAKIRADGRYRAPLAVLRRFTRSDIELRLGDDTAAPCDPAELSLAVTAWIGEHFHGDRGAATAFAWRAATRALGVRGAGRWPGPERAALLAFCPLLAMSPGLAAWPAGEKAQLVALVRAKGGNEFRYFERLRSHPRLESALRSIASARN